jgi:transposase
MSIETNTLPNDITELQTMILYFKDKYEKLNIEKTASEEKLKAEVVRLTEQVRLFKYRFFGPRSERLTVDVGQGELFNEAEATVATAKEKEETVHISYNRKKRKGVRSLDLSRYPCEEIVLECSQEGKIHSCGREMNEFGFETFYKIRLIPKQIIIVKYIRKKYVCACQGVDTEGVEGAIRIAPMPPQILEKSVATPSLLADVFTAKFCDSLPFYRQEKIFNRYGFAISRETLSRWAIQIFEKAEVLQDLLEKGLLAWDVMSMDETPTQVLSEKDRKNETRSYMWVCRGGPPDKPIVLYSYRKTRSAEFVREFLKDWKGTLICDGYPGYTSAAKDIPITLAGCWAHARRRLLDAQKASPVRLPNVEKAIEYIRQLYAVERKARGLDADDVLALRKAESVSIMNEFKTWLDATVATTPPTSNLGKAIRYILNDWKQLTVYLEDGRIPIDNNLTENCIRPFVIGKKNWLFSACPAGARASAFMYSQMETSKANGIEPYWYVNYMLEMLPYCKNEQDYQKILPNNVTVEQVAGYFKIDPIFVRYRLPDKE